MQIIARILITYDLSVVGDGDAILMRASRDVHAKYKNLLFFNARWVFIVTWHNVMCIGATVSPPPVSRINTVFM